MRRVDHATRTILLLIFIIYECLGSEHEKSSLPQPIGFTPLPQRSHFQSNLFLYAGRQRVRVEVACGGLVGFGGEVSTESFRSEQLLPSEESLMASVPHFGEHINGRLNLSPITIQKILRGDRVHQRSNGREQPILRATTLSQQFFLVGHFLQVRAHLLVQPQRHQTVDGQANQGQVQEQQLASVDHGDIQLQFVLQKSSKGDGGLSVGVGLGPGEAANFWYVIFTQRHTQFERFQEVSRARWPFSLGAVGGRHAALPQTPSASRGNRGREEGQLAETVQ